MISLRAGTNSYVLLILYVVGGWQKRSQIEDVGDDICVGRAKNLCVSQEDKRFRRGQHLLNGLSEW